MTSYSYSAAGDGAFRCALDRVRVSMTGNGAAVLVVGWRIPVNLPLSLICLGNCRSEPVEARSVPRPDVCEALGLDINNSGNSGFVLKYLVDSELEPVLTFYHTDGNIAGTAHFDSTELSELRKTQEQTPPSWLRRVSQFVRKLSCAEPFGINVIGYIRGEIGIGESTRLIAGTITGAGIPISIYNVEPNGIMRYNRSEYDKYISDELPYSVNLVHLNPPELQGLDEANDTDLFAGRYNICFWLWETETLPERWLGALSMADEIWCPSEYLCRTFRKHTDKPVVKIVYPIAPHSGAQYDREYFGLDGGLIWFLCMFDAHSVMERKNPIGTVRAYVGAFGEDGSKTGLVVKINNPSNEVLAILERETHGLPNVRIIHEPYSKEQVNSLISCCDVLVSLHRAEGFGLPIAEAMYFGKPVIATGFSANTEFMTSENGLLVDFTLVEIPNEVPQYGGHGYWAQPDIRHASEHMRRLAEDPVLRKQLGKTAAEHIREHFSEKQAAAVIRRHIGKMRRYGRI